jgi:hypothetical protein
VPIIIHTNQTRIAPHVRLLHACAPRSSYWDSGVLVGGDPLNNALMAIWGWLRGGFGVKPTLTRGVVTTNDAAPQLEGATWTFAYLGKDFCVKIQGGVTVQCGTNYPLPADSARK